MSLDRRDGRRTLHHHGGKSCGRRENALHEQRRWRVQGRDRLRRQDLHPGRPDRVLQRLRAEFRATGILEHRTVGHLRADEVTDEEATRHRVRSSISESDYSAEPIRRSI